MIGDLADLHLGFRQFHRQTAGGLNQREADVANAFRRAIEQVIAERPDVVIVAGAICYQLFIAPLRGEPTAISRSQWCTAMLVA